MPKRKVLVVDDDKELLLGLSVYLEANKYEVLFATNGNSAGSLVKRHDLDLVILDLGLPDGEGYGVMDVIEELPNDKRPPVIVVSAREAHSEEARALDRGAAEYFQKPADIYDLLDAIQRTMPRSTQSVN